MDSHPAMLDTVTLEAVLTDMMSVDRNKEAVHIFFAWKQTRLNYLVTKLAILVLSSPHCEVRAMSAILLRKLVAKNEFHLWPNLPDTTQTTLKSTLLKSIECETGQDIVYRVFSSLRINISNFFSLLPVYLSATEWREKYAALFVLRELLEAHPEMVIDTMDQIVSGVLNSLQDPSSMVRYAVMDVFGQLSTNFGPQLLVQYHHGLMPALISGLDGHPRLQVLAAKLITSILKNCNSDILTPEQFNMIVKNLYEKKEQQTLWDALKSIVASVCGINEAENGISNLKYHIEKGTGRIIFIRIKFLDEEFGIKEIYYIGNTFYVV